MPVILAQARDTSGPILPATNEAIWELVLVLAVVAAVIAVVVVVRYVRNLSRSVVAVERHVAELRERSE